MKREKTLARRVLACLLLGIAAVLLLCGCDSFTGERIKNPDAYLLDIEKMTGTDSHKMTLSAGDVLRVRFEMIVTFPYNKDKPKESAINLSSGVTYYFDGTTLYTGNGRGEAKDFTVGIPADGEYTFTVKAENARGTLHIRRNGTPEKTAP